MTDIEERIRSYNNAFEGLLSLVPEIKGDSQLKRKQTKEESKKAKKAKLDAGSTTEGTLAKVAHGSDNKEAVEVDDTREKVKVPKKKKKREKQQKVVVQSIGPGRKDVEVRESLRSEDTNATPSRSQLQSQPDSADSPKTQNATPFEAEVDAPTNDSESEEDVQMGSGDSTPQSQSTTLTSPDAIELGSSRTSKIVLGVAARAEKRALLAARIEELRAKRQAANGAGAKNRQELMEARRTKEEARKERKKQLRLEARTAEEAKRKEAQALQVTEDSPESERGRQQRQNMPVNNFSFSAVTFDDGQELDASLTDFKKSRKRRGPTDVLGQLKHIEAKKARIQNMDSEKQQKIQEKELWSKALKQAAGEKVRDDEKLLKKSLKRQEQVKQKSEREWKERIGNVTKSKAMKQRKREENLAARREQKKAGKSGKKIKAGGKKKVQMKKKRGARPGFEGSMKTKAGGGGLKKGKK